MASRRSSPRRVAADHRVGKTEAEPAGSEKMHQIRDEARAEADDTRRNIDAARAEVERARVAAEQARASGERARARAERAREAAELARQKAVHASGEAAQSRRALDAQGKMIREMQRTLRSLHPDGQNDAARSQDDQRTTARRRPPER
jgi:uncharacterized coiled-coil DUF342 family protein